MTKELNLNIKLEGAGWDNVLPHEINREAGQFCGKLAKLNTAGGTIPAAEGTFIGKPITVAVKDFVTA